MIERPPIAELDVRELPTYGFSSGSLMWWGTWGLMLIEGSVFALAIMMAFYLQSVSATWPLDGPPPDLLWGSLNIAVMLASAVPNHFAKRASEREERGQERIWMGVCLLFALVFLGIRVMEFRSLHVPWDANAYGSVIWLLLGLHTTHLVTDAVDTAVLLVLLFTRRFDNRRHSDVSENAMYWYFVILSWLPIYAVIYLVPRI